MDKKTQVKEIDFSVIVMLESLIQDMGVRHGHDTQGEAGCQCGRSCR